MSDDEREECFVIMPISDPEGYEESHFEEVYKAIVRPACEAADFKPHRADEGKASDVIQLDILARIIDAPIAICDLSSRNPNVFFELGLRQAFGKPVVLIQEIGTPRVFDISPIRAYEYDPRLRWNTVEEDVAEIGERITATYTAAKDGPDINSLVRLLGRPHADRPEVSAQQAVDDRLHVLSTQVGDIARSLERLERASTEQRRVGHLRRGMVAGRDVASAADRAGASAAGLSSVIRDLESKTRAEEEKTGFSRTTLR